MGVLVEIVFLISAALVFYHSYRYLWLHVIKLFEPQNSSKFNSKYTNNDDGISIGQNSFVQMIHNDELSISNIKIINFLKKFSRIAFATNLSSSFIVIEFILYRFMFDQSVGDETSELQSSLWYLNVLTITLNLIIIHPLLILILIINKFFKSKLLNNLTMKTSTTIGIFIVWLIFLSNFDKFTDLDIIDSKSSIIAYYLLRISIIGITLISTLNGIGSFSTVYYRVFKKLKSNPIQSNQQSLKNLEQTLQKTNELIQRKQNELGQDSQHGSTDDDGIQRRPSLYTKKSFIDVNKLNPFTNTSSIEQEMKNELNALKTIKNDVYLKILRLEKSIDEDSYQSNKQQHIQIITKIIKTLLTIYCSFKIIQVSTVELISLFNSKFKNDVTTKESDPLVLTIVKTIQIFINIEDENILINQLSFIVSGVLFLCSINGVFLTFQHLYKFLPLDLSRLNQSTEQTKNQSVSIMKNLLISELTGIYTLATILILKSNLTSNFSSKLNTLLSITNQNLSISQLDHWFDKIYLLSCLFTAISIKVAEHLSDDDDGFEDQVLAGKIV